MHILARVGRAAEGRETMCAEGHGRGRRDLDAEGCRCPGMRLERFVEPCLLLLLRRKSAHGYQLIDCLSSAGFEDGRVHPGAVYRCLRRMELDGVVRSSWETGRGGPARRLYELTPEGEELLTAWAGELARKKERLECFLRMYDRLR